jgi:regulatory protein
MNSLAYGYMSLDNSYPASNTYSLASNEDKKAIKSMALRYLARREYSRLELFRKLSLKFSSGENIQFVLDQLKDQGYQSDDRFTEMFIRTKVRAGNGPFKIKIELREKGICESTLLSAFDRQAIDWLEQAKKVHHKHFANQLETANDGMQEEIAEQITGQVAVNTDMQLVAKQIRYLKNKGFYQEHIDKVVNI